MQVYTWLFFLKYVNEFLKALADTRVPQQGYFDHDTNVGMVTFGLGGHLEAKIASKKFA